VELDEELERAPEQPAETAKQPAKKGGAKKRKLKSMPKG
jgi:hypothetical protein